MSPDSGFALGGLSGLVDLHGLSWTDLAQLWAHFSLLSLPRASTSIC